MKIPDLIIDADGVLFDQYQGTTYRERTDNLVKLSRTLSASQMTPSVLVFFSGEYRLDADGDILIAYGIDASDVRNGVRRIQRPGPHRTASASAEVERRKYPEAEAFAVLDQLSGDDDVS